MISRFLSKHSTLTVVLFIIFIAALTFLPLISQLGYYRDDWHVAWAGFTSGPQAIFTEHLIDRPFNGVTYALTYMLVGDSPTAWQFYSFGAHLAAALVLLWLLRMLWPKEKLATTLIALLFLIYPGFLQQPGASSHQNILVSLLFALISIALSIKAALVTDRKRRLPFILGAMLTGGVGYLIIEWIVGMEVVRGVFLAYLLWRDGGERKFVDRAKAWGMTWLPYLFVTALFLFWRLFLFTSARAATDAGALAQRYLGSPLTMLIRLLVVTGRDFIDTVFLAWAVPLYNLMSDASYSDVIISVLLAAVGVALLIFFFRIARNWGGENNHSVAGPNQTYLHICLLGLLIALLMLLPPILADRSVAFTDSLDRYTLAASVGVAMAVVGAIFYLIKSDQRVWICALFIVSSMLTQYHNEAYFRDSWNYQMDLWWQLWWRAPDLKTGTTLIPLLPSGYHLAEAYEVWAPANLIYNTHQPSIDIAGETLNRETLIEVMNGSSYGRNFRNNEFTIDFKNSLVASLPGYGACLHVIDRNNLELSEFEDPMIRYIAGVSRIDLIDTNASTPAPVAVIFGKEPDHDWCYYYEKASLARQTLDWEEVAALGDEARERGLAPQDESEWMPFYEGYAYAGRIEEANKIGETLRADAAFIRPYCQFQRSNPTEDGDKIHQYIVDNVCPQSADGAG